MNDQQHAFWLAYIRQLADLMRLRDWDIKLARTGPTNGDAGASNAIYYGRRYAELHLSTQFFAADPDDQRHMIAHELMHCHFDDTWESVRLHPLDDDYFWSVFKRETEVLVDTMALVIAPFLPLPDESHSAKTTKLRDALDDLARTSHPKTADPIRMNYHVLSGEDVGTLVASAETIASMPSTNGAVR